MEVVVGTEPNIGIWNIPIALLDHHCTVVRTPYKYRGLDITDTSIHRKRFDKSVLQLFVQWLYSGTLPSNLGTDLEGVQMGIRLWGLGDILRSKIPLYQST